MQRRRRGPCSRFCAAKPRPRQLAAFVVALRSKGETVTELTGMADTMIEFATPIEVSSPAVDIVGSGGDQAHTVNISTMAAIVMAAAGARVVKHGNRAASSACGAADVLEALGVVLDLEPEHQQAVIQQTGIGFLFAPHYHPALRFAGAPRVSSVSRRPSISSVRWLIPLSPLRRRWVLPTLGWLG